MKVKTTCLSLVITFALVLFAASLSCAEDPEKRFLLLPYPFFNDTIGSGLGVAAIAENYIQPQSIMVGSALGSTDGTGMLFLMARNHRLPWFQRLFVEPTFTLSKYENIQIYTIANPDFPNETPGSNDSSEDNFIESEGSDVAFDLNVRYLLPIGHGRDKLLPQYSLNNGIPTSGFPGGYSWNPFESGQTFVETQFFYRNQGLDEEELDDQETLGIELALTWDNTDFYQNPSRGSFWRLFGARDWGAMNDNPSWTILGGEVSKYFDLGPAAHARQRNLAFNLWTVDSLTWESFNVEDGERVYHRPPSYKGANLGGLWRLRGYPATRFRDRAALHYSGEYRHTLEWNPLKDFTLNGRLDVDWLQLVAFGDLGRVADEWGLDTLHEDMKWTVGGGVRVLVNNLVVRLDMAISEEESITQVFISHPWPKR